ncbi:MAG: hypothetical protein ACI82I_002332, partial [Gammaproteobacteria bacterium]
FGTINRAFTLHILFGAVSLSVRIKNPNGREK